MTDVRLFLVYHLVCMLLLLSRRMYISHKSESKPSHAEECQAFIWIAFLAWGLVPIFLWTWVGVLRITNRVK